MSLVALQTHLHLRLGSGRGRGRRYLPATTDNGQAAEVTTNSFSKLQPLLNFT